MGAISTHDTIQISWYNNMMGLHTHEKWVSVSFYDAITGQF